MHFSLLEKFGLSVLICAWLIYGANFIGDKLVSVETHGSAVAAVAPTAEPTAGAAEAPPADLGTLLASGSEAEGEKIFNKCKACHTIEDGAGAKVGPNLHGIIGAKKAHMDGFAYSSGLAGKGGTWTYEDLNTFLTSPKDFIEGTKMTFAGLKDPKQRADIILFLRANTPNPLPLPEPKAPAPVAAAPAAAPAKEASAAPVAAAPAPAADIKTLMASADPAAGEKVFSKCKACHTIDKGGKAAVGPNLWGVVGGPKAHMEGFGYSEAMMSHHGDTWTYENLFVFLDSPRDYVPGTKMTFAGLKKPEDRANVIAYLRSMSDNPPPLP